MDGVDIKILNSRTPLHEAIEAHHSGTKSIRASHGTSLQHAPFFQYNTLTPWPFHLIAGLHNHPLLTNQKMSFSSSHINNLSQNERISKDLLSFSIAVNFSFTFYLLYVLSITATMKVRGSPCDSSFPSQIRLFPTRPSQTFG